MTDPASLWEALAEQFPSSGLWPVMLQFLEGGSGRPWEVGEFDPAAEGDVDALDPGQVLETGWHDGVVPIDNPWLPGTGPLAPFGAAFPGLAPPPAGPGPETDALPMVLPAAEVSAVLRSSEDRFGAIFVGIGFATMTLLVTRPPTEADDALRLAAEVAAFCPDALWQPGGQWPYEPREATLDALSRSLVRGGVWRLSFD